MADLFIELYSEEIPAKLQIDAREKIKLNLCDEESNEFATIISSLVSSKFINK